MHACLHALFNIQRSTLTAFELQLYAYFFFFHMAIPSVGTILLTSSYDSPSSCLGGPFSYLGNIQKSSASARSSLHAPHEQP